jgi:hypothetical protein
VQFNVKAKAALLDCQLTDCPEGTESPARAIALRVNGLDAWVLWAKDEVRRWRCPNPAPDRGDHSVSFYPGARVGKP